jgi:S-formylglutathione hydrolase FrmB
MSRVLRISTLIFCLGFSAAAARGQSRLECDALPSRILRESVHYCVLLPPSYAQKSQAGDRGQKYPVLYLLHGLGDNEQSLVNTGGWDLIDNLRQQHKIGDFLIVTPRGKRTFYINSAGGGARYSDFFLREFMPTIEKKYRVRAGRQWRAISGMSMGGYGALRFAFAYPQLFSAVSAQSPALVTEPPKKVDTALHSGSPLGAMLGDVFGRPINVAHWQQNDPFALAEKNQAGIRKLAIYLNCGKDDDYGFEKGTAALHRQLDEEGIRNTFHLYPGNHSLTYFLTHLDETMEFHWRAFAGASQISK